MFDKIADSLISQGGLWGTLFVASWALFITAFAVLWRVWRKAETDFDKERIALYEMVQKEQQAKFEAALNISTTVNSTMSELKTLIFQMLTKS